jgi:hypothetical protein
VLDLALVPKVRHELNYPWHQIILQILIGVPWPVDPFAQNILKNIPTQSVSHIPPRIIKTAILNMDRHWDISIISLKGRLDLGKLNQYLFILLENNALMIL